MSVIVTGMDMPYRCAKCGGCYDYREDEYFCALHNDSFDIDIDKDKPKRCPLKSIDGLIKKINEYLIKEGFGSEYRNDVAEIIKEYCKLQGGSGRMIDFDTITPGDVIKNDDGQKGIVTKATPDRMEIMYSDGSSDYLKEEHLQYWTYAGERKELLSKLLSL